MDNTNLTSEKRCVQLVYPNDRWGSFHGSQCSKIGIVQRDGKWYCKVHDPEYRKQKQEASMAKYQEEMHNRIMVRKRADLLNVIFSGVSTEQIEQLKDDIREDIKALFKIS